ncbi:MAG: ABC transporter permease [Sphaerochaeta sp.]|jgi:putative ABC transport system permease protein|nr:ABC transporter permease [Sphaerochaeta sp.]PKL29179.1 MAG: peptide ABC transporter permease [Spirochaetae bacterium HGW-Spirochaetae-2]
MIWENIKLALKDMMASKMRTLLSLLGIVIGVASVIAILTLGQSATKSITQTIVEGGLEMVTIFPIRSEKAANEFTEDFGERLVANVSDIKTVLPVNSSTATIRIGQNSLSASVTGVLSTYAEILDYEVSEGAFFTLSDNMANRQVVVLGSDVAEELFPDGNAIGEYVSIFRNQAKSYQVVAVMQEKDASFNLQFNGSVFIPYNTYAQRYIKPTIVGSYVVRVADGADALAVSDAITEYLDATVGSDAYRVFSPASLADMAEQITGTFSSFLAAIAAISLLVGGIGIMNIMLVSVAERTREIGVRKAMGASPWTIMGQFITEAIVLTITGGIIGIGLGTLLSWLVADIVGWNLYISYASFLFAAGFSTLVGVFFGWYPAMKASRLDPIEALNYE